MRWYQRRNMFEAFSTLEWLFSRRFVACDSLKTPDNPKKEEKKYELRNNEDCENFNFQFETGSSNFDWFHDVRS